MADDLGRELFKVGKYIVYWYPSDMNLYEFNWGRSYSFWRITIWKKEEWEDMF